MSNIIHLITAADEPRVDSREIAIGLGTQHHSVVRLIDRYTGQFERFGLVRFEIDAVEMPGARGKKQVRFASLNEDQCYFLLSLSRNTPRVVELKAELVAAFGSARRAGVAHALSAWQQLQRLEIEDSNSLVRASFGSRLMLDRKRKLPGLRDRRADLEIEFAPQLFKLTA